MPDLLWLTSAAVTHRLRSRGGSMMWLILVVSFLTGQLYSQAPAVGQPVRVSSLGCNAVASSSHHQSPGLTLEQQACSPHFSLTGFSFSGPKRNSENDWSSRFGDRLSAVAMPVNNDFWSSALGVPGFGAGASQNQDNPPQSKTNPPASTVPESTTKDKKEQQTSPTATTGSPGHIFWVIPAYKVSYQKGFQPLTPKEKFQEWAKGSYDPLGLGAGAVEAATLEHSSSKDGFCGYGGGWAGYGKCFGSLELDANISSFIGDYALTVLWHQDPRYFRLGEGTSSGRRLWYAVSRVFVTYNDSGRTVVYSSALTGTVAAAAISNLYCPQQDRTAGHAMSRIALDLGNSALYDAAAEFWPDIHRKLPRHHQKKEEPSTAAGEKHPAAKP